MAKAKNDKCYIMGKEYTISTYTPSYDGMMPGNDDPYSSGLSHHSKLLIKVNNALPEDEFADTLLHEILHGYDYHCQLELTERQVHVMAAGLIEFFNNPKNRHITSAIARS